MKTECRACKRVSAFAVPALVLLMLATAGVAADGAEIDSRQSQWERAAVNYEWAARSQEEAASVIIEEAQKLRNSGYSDQKQYNKNMRSAGDREDRAAGLEASAGGNYDKAAENWSRIGGKHKAKKSDGQAVSTEQMANIARNSATIAYQRSAELYEMSAEAYYKANQPLRQASQCQKAARMREKIAGRL